MDTAFEAAYARMMERAIRESRGERRRRLTEDHGVAEKAFAEQVWWPVVGHLNDLHPEFELRDLYNKVRYIDYAYVPSASMRVAIEVDGFGPHWRDISRWQFDSNTERQNLLLLEGWHMLRFTYDGMMERARRCQQTLLMALAKWGQQLPGKNAPQLNVNERAILHFYQSYPGDCLTPGLVKNELLIDRHTAVRYLKSLVVKGYLCVERSTSGRIMRYRISGPEMKGSDERSDLKAKGKRPSGGGS